MTHRDYFMVMKYYEYALDEFEKTFYNIKNKYKNTNIKEMIDDLNDLNKDISKYIKNNKSYLNDNNVINEFTIIQSWITKLIKDLESEIKKK